MEILLVDDHTLFRNGLKMLLDTLPGYEVTGEASNGKEFLGLVAKYDYDIVFLDIEMPEINGIEAARRAIEIKPELKIITLSMYGDEEYYDQMVDAGAKGFLLKNTNLQEVKASIDTVMNGGNYFSQELMQSLLRNYKSVRETKEPEAELSEREIEILLLICSGLSNQEIGDHLFISKRTVEKHRANILCKTNCKNTAGLVMYAIKNQLIAM
ncbi:MAG: response regulator transcription factor [Bacteroidia bacterium]|nr:response regulator transcription factor [Bacteroidia bacterium]